MISVCHKMFYIACMVLKWIETFEINYNNSDVAIIFSVGELGGINSKHLIFLLSLFIMFCHL